MFGDSYSQLERLGDADGSVVLNVLDAYGWIVPAVLMTILLLGVLILIAWVLEELPFELPVFEGIGGIFKWSRAQWGPTENRTSKKSNADVFPESGKAHRSGGPSFVKLKARR